MCLPSAAQTLIVEDSLAIDSVIVQDTMIIQDTMMESSEVHHYQWRDVREMRDSLRFIQRTARTRMNMEVRQLRDSVRAETFATIDSMPHELRIGWGDMLFESLVWHEEHHPTILPTEYIATYKEHYRYTQHWFVEYLYNMGYWYSIGIQVDYSGVLWDNVTRNGQGTELVRVKNQNFHNITLLPTIRFAYFHSEYVSLYSALGLGLNINTGTETDYKGRTTTLAPAVNISLMSVRVGKGRWYGMVELGGMFSLMNSNEVYMLGSRICTASVGCRL